MLKIFPEMVRYSSAYQINYKTFIFNAIFRIQLLSMNYWLIFYLLAEIFQDFQLTVITGIMEWKTTLYGWINLFPLDPQFISIFKKKLSPRLSQQWNVLCLCFDYFQDSWPGRVCKKTSDYCHDIHNDAMCI